MAEPLLKDLIQKARELGSISKLFDVKFSKKEKKYILSQKNKDKALKK